MNYLNKKASSQKRGSGRTAVWAGACLWFAWAAVLWANPQGLSVVQGSATVTSVGSQLSLTLSPVSVLDWRSFNINPGETTTFIQPSSASIVWNRINDVNPSQIWGNLNANGYVVLYNSQGFFFGPNSVINVGGLLVTTAPVSPPQAAGGGLWQYNGSPPAASIVNFGRIAAKTGGSLFMIAEKVMNHGTLMAPDGTIGLYAGKEVLVSERPDGRGLNAKVRLPEGSVDNRGQLIADAGTIMLNAQVVNQDGLVQANSVRERNGIIELVASEQVSLGSHSALLARGDPSPSSDGGKITIKSDHAFADTASSQISVAAGNAGGAGGTVSISAPHMPAIHSRIDGGADSPSAGGTLVIDPTDILISQNVATGPGNDTVHAGDPPDILRLDVNSSFVGFSHITLQAARDISLTEGTVWDLNASTGISAGGSLLTLEAGRNLVFQDNSRIVAESGWSVRLAAGADFSTPGKVKAGVGGIYFNGGPVNPGGPALAGNGSLETSDGAIGLVAGNEIRVGSGFVHTVGGGSIQVKTLTGDVDAGLKPDYYQFSRQGYQISSFGLGGIGTAQGGDVSIDAGRDILSFIPTVGAFGPGNVTLTAGQRILGNFLARQGTGLINAGLDVGSSASPVTLNLISGAWQVTAARDLFLNEVRNPNGVFNSSRMATGARVAFQFDYAPDARVNLTAGNSVQLLGSNLARTAGNRDLLPVYPPQLEIHAGAGGVLLGNDVILYPSAQGSLNITTTAGGSLSSLADKYCQLVMSDSSDPRYTTFAAGHANPPLHLNDGLDPIRIKISGDIQNLFMRLPKAADIEIDGNALNFSYAGQNLAGTDQTRIQVGGDLTSRSDRTETALAASPDFSIFDPLLTIQPGLGARLSYDSVTGQLSFQGRMTSAEREFLLNPQVRAYDAAGNPLVDNRGNPVLVPAAFTPDHNALETLFNSSQDIPTTGLAFEGLQLGGPGRFSISARNMDLGISKGIRSLGPLGNEVLGQWCPGGANVEVTLAQNLEMTASQIASFSGGAIQVAAGGKLGIGGQQQFSSDDTPKGIFTTSGGDVWVSADQDINVNGSRIASYNGGNIHVSSAHGNVNAGEGGLGAVSIYRTQVDPQTGRVTVNSTTIPGSGILAASMPDSTVSAGNITVEAGRDIIANRGGIIQLMFHSDPTTTPAIQLKAGRNIDASNSGIIGGNVSLEAQGDINGLVIATRNVSIQTIANVNITAVAQGGVSINAAGSVSGSVVGGAGVSVTGESISAALISQNVNAVGDTSGAKVGVPQTAVARSESKIAADAKDTVADSQTQLDVPNDDDISKKRAPMPQLAKSTGRVTVILPPN